MKRNLKSSLPFSVARPIATRYSDGVKFLPQWTGAIFVSLLAVTSTSARLSMDVTAGFGGKAMPQSWMPVLVEFFNDGPPVEGFVEVNSPTPSHGPIYSKPVVLPT